LCSKRERKQQDKKKAGRNHGKKYVIQIHSFLGEPGQPRLFEIQELANAEASATIWGFFRISLEIQLDCRVDPVTRSRIKTAVYKQPFNCETKTKRNACT
jgi:hypothetical protein